ncbi:MAG: hypothetical protein DRI56_05205 [Chloroflexota bacterium]|nr:MAG: hypothetical protein DRI56_05205 [Chloroflexota bacterium]
MGMIDDFDNDFDFEEMEPEESQPPEEAGNKTFLIVAGIMGGILLLSLIVIAVYAMTIYPNRQAEKQTQRAEINAQNTEIALKAQLTEQAEAWTATPTATSTPLPTNTNTIVPTEEEEATATSVPEVEITDTPVVAAQLTDTPSPHTKTVEALLTQQAGGSVTPTPTELPDTGFADNIGAPGLFTVAGVLLVIIILSRRLRKSSV